MEKPFCTKCEGHHWRFVACDQVAEQDAKEQAATTRRQAAVVRMEWRNDRGRVWQGDRLNTVTRSGANTYWRKHDDGPKAA